MDTTRHKGKHWLALELPPLPGTETIHIIVQRDGVHAKIP